MKLRAIIFWLLMLGSVVGLWWEGGTNLRDFLRTGAFVVPVVLLTFWFRGRFSGRKRRMADVAIYSVCGIVLTSAIAVWEFLLVSAGHESQRNLLAGVVASIIFAACCSVLLWSILRLRKLPS
ncbi:MAG TPA: hypothetical protein VFR24_17920 [Candidatus Angelobacter sp.]|nr:hypothetical protein [Candidatus Angelobacter sp.]